MPLDHCIQLFDRQPQAFNCLMKLINTQSKFMGPTPRTIGVDLVSELAASKIQQSLDVKHVKKGAVTDCRLDRIIPQIKIDLAYNHPQAIWIRFYCDSCSTFNFQNINESPVSVLYVSTNVYELYCVKNINVMMQIILQLESNHGADIIFCSELPAFLYNPLLFLSNYIKFMWCNTLRDRNIFDPFSYDDIRLMCVYATYGLLYLNTNNLSNMPQHTHGPLVAYSGERPKIALSKFDNSRIYVNEGSRALQSLKRGSDFGTCSNFMEFISAVKLDYTKINDII